MFPTPRPFVTVFIFIFQHTASGSYSSHIRMCSAECGTSKQRPIPETGFVFIRCKVIAEIDDAQMRQAVQTSEGTIMKVKSVVCKKQKGVPKRELHEAGGPNLLIMPSLRPCQYWHRMNLATMTTQSFPILWKKALAIAYLRNESRFLIANKNEIISSGFQKTVPTTRVRKVSNVHFMRLDNKRQLVFLSQLDEAGWKVSRMKPNGQRLRFLVNLPLRSICNTAVDSSRRLLYIATYDSILLFNYEGEKKRTLISHSFEITTLTVDEEAHVLYFLSRLILMKMSRTRLRIRIVSLEDRRHTFQACFMKLHMNILYIGGRSSGTILSVDVHGKPILKAHKFAKLTPWPYLFLE